MKTGVPRFEPSSVGRFNQFVTERPKFLNSLKKFGALAECPTLLEAFPRSITTLPLLSSFVTALHAALKRHQSAVGVN